MSTHAFTPDDIKHDFSDGLYAKQASFPAGAWIVKHKHDYSHLSILAKGTVLVQVDDEEQIYEAPACIEIKGGKMHAIMALDDAVWFCIHATDEKDPANVDQVLIERKGV